MSSLRIFFPLHIFAYAKRIQKNTSLCHNANEEKRLFAYISRGNANQNFAFRIRFAFAYFAFVVFDLNLLASMSGDEEGFARFSSQNLPTDAEIDTLTINKRSSFGFKRMRVQLWVQKEQQKGVS